jgi:sugar phosphate isomerase/epimerase
MKLAVISDEVAQDFDRVVAFARDFNLDGIEIRSVWDKPPHKLTDDDVASIKQKASAAGLEICGIAAPVFKCNIRDEAEVAEHVGILQRCVEVAKRWETPLIRVFTGWRAEEPPGEHAHGARLFREQLLPQTAGTGITLGIENEYSTNVADSDEILSFFGALDAPGVTLVWDPCNILYMHKRTDSLGHDYPRIKHLVGHFHVKDARRVEGGEQPAESTAVGDGEVQIREHFEALRTDGYDGWVSLETHWRMSKVLTEEEANSPMGQAFSRDAEPATRECMTRLVSWVRG